MMNACLVRRQKLLAVLGIIFGVALKNTLECCADGVCCDTTTHELVKNYVNGTGEAGYTCCSIGEKEDFYSGWTVAGAINGTCCSGWTSFYKDNTQHPDAITISSNTFSYSIRQNGGVYYCAEDSHHLMTTNVGITSDAEVVYISDSQLCYLSSGSYTSCSTSQKGDPAYGKTYCHTIYCP